MSDEKTEGLRAELAVLRAERGALLRWKRWTVAQEMLRRGRASLRSYREEEELYREVDTLLAYGRLLRRVRTRGDTPTLMSEVQAVLDIDPLILSGVELGREPPFDDETTKKLCAMAVADPAPLLDAAERANKLVLELTKGVKA